MTSTLLISGLRRSGNHLIQHWLCSHFKTAVFCNNMPDLSDESLVRRRKTWLYREGEFELGRIDDPELLLLGYEDKSAFTTYDDWYKYLDRKQTSGVAILILRSFYNLAASRIMKPEQTKSFNHDLPARWLDHARACLDSKNFINYDKFVASSDYRAKLERKLLLPSMPDFDMSFVPNFGGGSSFSGPHQPLERYKQVEIPQEWMTDEIARVNKEIFGWKM